MDAQVRIDILNDFASSFWCYSPVVNERGIGLAVVEANIAGYTPVPKYHAENWIEAEAKAKEENKKRHISQRIAADIVASSIAKGKVQANGID